MEAACEPMASARFDSRERMVLPEPVQRFLLAVLTEGMQISAVLLIEHTGGFVVDGANDQWKSFSSVPRSPTGPELSGTHVNPNGAAASRDCAMSSPSVTLHKWGYDYPASRTPQGYTSPIHFQLARPVCRTL